jgi:hypothetical protein
VDKVIAVAEYFGVSVDYLIFGKSEPEKSGLGSLVDAASDLSPEQVVAILRVVEALKK